MGYKRRRLWHVCGLFVACFALLLWNKSGVGGAEHPELGMHISGRMYSRYITTSVQDGSVGITTHCELDGPRIEFRWGEIFSAVQTSSEANPA
jgi:hypothetical protein